MRYLSTVTTASTEFGKIVPIKQINDLTSIGFANPFDVENIQYNPYLELAIQNKINGLLYSKIINYIESGLIESSSPFDSVYISKLKSDEISNSTIMLLNKLCQIQDLSDELSFGDDE